MVYVQVLIGFLLLLGGAEGLVRGAASIARRMGISPMIIGMTVVAFGTSAPELIVTLDASLRGAAGMAVGNIVGSNIANVLLIVGLTALLATIPRQRRPMTTDALLLTAATLVFAGTIWTGLIERWEGVILVLAFWAIMGRSGWNEYAGRADEAAETRSREAEEMSNLPGGLWFASAAVVLGLAGLIVGSNQIVDGGVAIAQTFGVSDAVIGLTLIAIGTSLPELAASVVAGLRGHADIAVGNVLGSNLFNMLLVGGVVAIVQPLPVDPQIVRFDVLIMVGATALFLPCLLGVHAGRLFGAVLLSAYVAYIAVQVLGIASGV